LGTTRNLTVPNLGFKEGVEPLWISGLSWRPEFVHCNVALRCCDATKEMCFFLAGFCGRVAWVIVRLHNTCRNSPSILQSEIPCKARPCIPKDGEHEFFCWWNGFEFLYSRITWMTIFHGLPFVFRVIMMNPGLISSGKILCQKLNHRSLLYTKIGWGTHYWWTLLLKDFEHWTDTKHEFSTLYQLPKACTNVSFLPLLATPFVRRPYLSINLRSSTRSQGS